MAERIHKITSPLGPTPELTLRRLNGHEALSRPYEYVVEMFSDDAQLKAADFLGAPLTVSIYNTETQKSRYFNGLVASFCYAGDTGRQHVYRAVLRPWLWFLTRTSDCRIFQNMDVPTILGKVFKDKNGFSDFDSKKLKATYRKWEYCVQYRESDFDFASRLMEQEGIYYYFLHAEGKHTLTLCDGAASHDPIEGEPKIPYRVSGESQLESERIGGWLRTDTVQSAQYLLRDFDFEKPKANLDVRQKIARTHKLAAFEQYDYPGEYVLSKPDGDHYVKVRIEELQSQYSVAYGEAKSYRLAPGFKFTLEDFARTADNIEYLITSTQTDVLSGEVGYITSDQQNLFDISFTAIDAKQPYRAPQVTPKPKIAGPQTAIVVGKAGEEIWTDKYGRVKVQFHWDREGKKDDQSSCWIRVAQLWAGKTWGGMHIPRVGQEVVVEFLEGDPDRPLITGRVYNFDQMPPYTLPANATQSGIKSRSSKEGLAENFNELRFEDKKGSEHVYFHAEKDMERIVENNEKITVGMEKKDPGDQTITIHNNQKLVVGNAQSKDGSQTIEIYKNRTETVKTGNETVTVELGNRDVKINTGNESLIVDKGNRDVKINTGNDSLTVGKGNLTIDVTLGKVTVTAAQSIELKVGGSSIKIEPMKITLKSLMVDVTADITLNLKGLITTTEGSALLNLKGGLVKIN